MLLKFLDVEHFVVTNALVPVTSTDIYTKDGNFDENGLFSDVIFGKDSDVRKKSFSYINLNCEIVHPTALDIINRLDRKLIDFIFTYGTYLLDDEGSLYEDPNGLSGVENFKKIFQKIKFRGGSSERESFIKLIQESYNSGVLFIRKILVIPPEFRPVFKDPATGEEIRDALNDFYIKILRHSNTMRSASGGGIFYDILNANMQKSVNDFDDYIKAKLGHKHGLIREQILGKRVDFSARTVIVNGPTLKPHEAGIPIGRAVSIFEPFILNVILKKKANVDNDLLIQKIKEFVHQEFSIDAVKKLLLSIKNNDTVPSDLFEMMFIVVSKAMEGRLVLLKRDPALRPESVRAFVPILTRNDVISISNLITSGFNADFDGDMMAVIHPLSNEAQEDAKKMIRVQSADNMSAMTIKLAKDTAIGIYILTKDYPINKKPIQITEELLEKSTDPTTPVIYKTKVTTMGRAIFNSCLPEGFRFIETPIKSSDMDKLLDEIYRKYAAKAVSNAAYKLMLYAYKFVTIASPSLTIDNFIMPDSIIKEKEKLELSQSVDENIKLLDKLQKMMEAHFSGTPLHDLIESGASKGWGQPFQIFVSKGFVTDVKGNLLPPIKGSYAEGLSAEEHFNASYGSRKGIVDRVISTSDTGYTSRQLVYLLNGVELDPHNEDCKTKRTLPVRLNKTIIGRLEGRYIVDKGTSKEFIKSNYKEGDVINLRSPIYCTAKNNKICLTCYGKKVAARVKTPYIGVLAAQLIGEEGTQATMRNFHCFQGLTLIVTDKYGIISFKDLWDRTETSISELDGCEEKLIDSCSVLDKDGWTKILNIKRHIKNPNSKIMFMRIRGGQFLICQDNHPHMLSNLNDSDQHFKETILTENSNYENYKAVTDNQIAKYFGKTDDELMETICEILNSERLEITRNIVSFNSDSLENIQKLMILLCYFNISVGVRPIMENYKNKQLFNLSFAPTLSQKSYFNTCNKMKSFRYLPDQFINRHTDVISVYKELPFYNEDFLYDICTESSTLIANGMWEHNSGGAVKLENKDILKDLVENGKGLEK